MRTAYRLIVVLFLLSNSCVFAQELSVVRSETNGKYGVKNEKGEIIIAQKYASVIILSGNSFVVYEEDPGWPMIINQKGEVLVSKTNYIGKVLEAYNNHFICQYYKDGRMADLVLFKAPDMVLYTFPIKYIKAEFVKDDCYSYVMAQTENPGERLSVDLKGKALTGTQNLNFDFIKGMFKPCNGYAVVAKDKGYDGVSFGVYDLTNNKQIIPCDFYDVAFDEKTTQIKAYNKVQTSTYNLYNMQGQLVKTWDQLKK